MGIAHWDDVEKQRLERGQMAGTWSNLGTPAGSYRCGVSRIELAPGEMPTPAHVHGEAEEIFYVLAGSGLTWLDEKAYEIGVGDCIVYKNSTKRTRSARAPTVSTCSPSGRASTSRAASFRAAARCGRSRATSKCRTAIRGTASPSSVWPDAEPERPANIVNVSSVEPHVVAGRRRRHLGGAAGSRWTGLTHIECDPGTLSGPPHVHSAEEELFVVLEGEGTLELWPDEREPVRVGSVVARPPGTRVAHAFRAGDSGLTLLAWGTREPNDICWYPRSKKIFWRGVGVIGRIEELDYWEGEALDA